MRGLTPKQQKFVDEYMIDLNATQASIRAGYSARNAGKIGPMLLGKVRIAEAISARQKKLSDKAEIKAERIINELAKIAFADMGNYATWGSRGITLKESADLTPDQTAAVSELSETVTESGGSTRFKLHDKKGALELLGKHLGMFKDRVELEVVGGIAEQLKAAREARNNGAK